ncbi:hypothetical protein V6V47_12790 [Micromonospora sp. CPCC 205539]|uniref:hypothetical protein n=1 Tax=Micromonospora sp. CPCC 205539 TaxID=3122408 RepID=UPI002FF1D16A
MSRVLGNLGDRMLERLVPKATAKADVSWYRQCYCSNHVAYIQLCHTVGGMTGCGTCYRGGGC